MRDPHNVVHRAPPRTSHKKPRPPQPTFCAASQLAISVSLLSAVASAVLVAICGLVDVRGDKTLRRYPFLLFLALLLAESPTVSWGSDGKIAWGSAAVSLRAAGATFDGRDASTALRNALALAAEDPNAPRVVMLDGKTLRIDSPTRIVVPANVTIVSPARYEGGDGTLDTSLPTIVFASPSGGLTMAPGSSLSGIALFGAIPGKIVDHLIEFQGQAGMDHVRLYVGRDGAVPSRTIRPGLSIATVENGGSKLQDGTFKNIPFMGGGVKGGRLTIRVEQGSVRGVEITAEVQADRPYFLFSIKDGALYPGSPPLSNLGAIAVAPMGRSRIRSVFMVASATTRNGLWIDGAFDFTDVTDFHYYSTSAGLNGTALVLGRVDGLSISRPKIFGASIAIDLIQPADDAAHPFATIAGLEIDGVNLGIVSKAPIRQLSIIGGFIRSVGRSITIDNPETAVTIHAVNFLSQADSSILIVQHAQIVITGNTFSSDSNGGGFAYIRLAPGAPGADSLATNSSDGRHSLESGTSLSAR